MSVSPILPGRLPGTLLADQLRRYVAQGQSDLALLQQQAATGQAFFRPSDRPAAASRTIAFQREIERNAQLLGNVGTDRNFLAASETALQAVSDGLNQAKTLLLAGTGANASADEKRTLAMQVRSLSDGILRAMNSGLLGRSLFGGTQTAGQPFQQLSGGRVLYTGDAGAINSALDRGSFLANNVDGETAFNALSPAAGGDLDPAVTLDTRLSALNGGAGVPLGRIRVTVDDGVNPAAAVDVDLTGAETVGDVKTRVEAAFPGPPGLTVGIGPGNDGLRFTPSAGTVAVADVRGGQTAFRLGIASAPAAGIDGGDLNPTLSATTRLSDLNGGAGVSLAGGLRVTSGDRAATIDLSAATTVEDAMNAIRSQAKAAGIELSVGLSDDGSGLAVASRISGEAFSIGENGGTTATDLKLRTLTGGTPLADLNRGLGVPVAGHTLDVTRRSGVAVSIDLSGAATVQQVLDRINAVDPGVLVASLNATGNGISLVDDDGASVGPLTVAANPLSTALGMAGTEDGGSAAAALVGADANPRESGGILHVLSRLSEALRAGDDAELTRLGPLLDKELSRFTDVRGDVATRLKSLDDVESRLLDRGDALTESLSKDFGADLAEVLTQVVYRQTTLEATLKVSAQTANLMLINYL